MMGKNVWHQKRSHSSSLKCPRSILNTLYDMADLVQLKVKSFFKAKEHSMTFGYFYDGQKIENWAGII